MVTNGALKQLFQRPRPDVVPHLREVMSMSFPSGHALPSAVVYLTLGTLSMHIAQRRLTKAYCMTVAMLATAWWARRASILASTTQRTCSPDGCLGYRGRYLLDD